MTREEFVKIVKTIDSVYCSSDKPLIKDQLAMEVWYSCLSDLDFVVCGKALKNIILTSKFRPTIADIRTEFSKLVKSAADELTEQDAWALVRKALRNGTYGAEEEYNALPPVVRNAVGHPSNIRTWSQLGSQEVETVIQSQFLRNYRIVQVRDDKDRILGAIGTRPGECIGLVENLVNRLEDKNVQV